jgi:two-component system sensor histidine kinase ChiS
MLQEKFNRLLREYVSTATLAEVRSQLESGERPTAHIRDLTVLCLDVVGYTGFAERHTPVEAAALLNNLFAICDVITRECNGDIDKFIGDAVMAVFVDANDAVRAAIKILSGLADFNRSRVRQAKEEVRVRIGINSGPVMQGVIGTSERKDVTVIGDVVNTASRIEGATEPMGLNISEATYARLRDGSGFERHQTVQVKNRREPVTMYRYAGELDAF